MTIKKRLKGTWIVSISFTLVIIACLLISMHQIKRAVDKGKSSSGIARGAAELTILARAYTASLAERPKKQWLERYDSLARLLSQASYDSSERDVIERLRETQAGAKKIFEELVASYEGEGAVPAPLRQLRQESRERLVTQLIGKNQEMEYSAYILDRRSTEEISAIQTRAFFLILGLIVLLLIVLSFASSRLYRAIVHPLLALEKATGQIAAGQLEFQAPETDDEVGRLSMAFNRMGHSLQDSYANLSRENAERKRAEEGLKELNETLEQRVAERTAQLGESEQRWATTLSSIGDAVIATDVSGLIAFMNAVAAELTGWTLRDALQKPVSEVFNIINEHSRSAVESPVAKVLREGMVVGLANHTVLVRKDGTEVPIDDSGAPIRDNYGKTMGVVLVFRDITERRKAEEKLFRAKEEWERTFASVPDMVTIIDGEHRILRVNEAMARRLGRKSEECVGLLCFEAVHGLSEPPDFCPHSRTLKDSRQHVEEVHEERLGGDFLVSTTPLHDERGQMIGTVHVAHDITERKRAEEALKKTYDELEPQGAGADRRTAAGLRKPDGADQGARANRSPTPPGPEDGGPRHNERRHRPRLQQHSCGHHRVHGTCRRPRGSGEP